MALVTVVIKPAQGDPPRGTTGVTVGLVTVTR
jgi:hypothetical protein